MDTSVEHVRDTRLDDTNNISNISTNVSSSPSLVSPSESLPRPSSFPIQSGNPFPPPPLRAATITAIANDMSSTYQIIANQSMSNVERSNQNIDNPTLTGITEKLNQNNLNENEIENENENENDTRERQLNIEEKQFLRNPLLSSSKFKIEVSLQHARQSLHELFSPFSSIPSYLFREAKGIIFLSVVKCGIGIGGALGSGIILSRKNNKWSNPCAIGLTGIQIGFDIGIERVDNILLLRDELTLKMFQNATTLNIGSDISIAAGPLGGEIKFGVVIDDNMSTTNIYSYSIAKGVYVGLSLNGSWIRIRDDWNEEFYGRKISGKEIISNYRDDYVANNNDYLSLIHLLNEYCRND